MTPSVLLTAALVLSGCGEARRALGLEKVAPDEFQVVARAPLNLPPDFQLRPPRPGEPRPQEQQPRDQARAALFKIEDAQTTNGAAIARDPNAPQAAPRAAVTETTSGETALLVRAGATTVPSDIRTLVDRESAVLTRADDGFIDRLLSFSDQTPGPVLVDANAEAKRLRENQALGLPVTDGETPKIERKRRGLFGDIF